MTTFVLIQQTRAARDALEEITLIGLYQTHEEARKAAEDDAIAELDDDVSSIADTDFQWYDDFHTLLDEDGDYVYHIRESQ